MHVDIGHPALPGHFPGHPVVPGVVLLSAVVARLPGHTGGVPLVTGFPSVKFLALLLPEQEFDVVFTAKRPGQATFEVVSGSRKLASGIVAYEER